MFVHWMDGCLASSSLNTSWLMASVNIPGSSWFNILYNVMVCPEGPGALASCASLMASSTSIAVISSASISWSSGLIYGSSSCWSRRKSVKVSICTCATSDFQELLNWWHSPFKSLKPVSWRSHHTHRYERGPSQTRNEKDRGARTYVDS